MGNLNLGRMSLPSFQYILFDLLISIKVFGISKFFWNQSKIVWNYWRMGKVIIKSNSELKLKYICEKNINLTFLVHVFYVVAQSHFVVEDVQINSMFSVASVLSNNEFITCFSRILNLRLFWRQFMFHILEGCKLFFYVERNIYIVNFLFQ